MNLEGAIVNPDLARLADLGDRWIGWLGVGDDDIEPLGQGSSSGIVLVVWHPVTSLLVLAGDGVGHLAS
ncbi:MAG: hypothetical protein ACK56F_10895, partial [bacterium]